MIERRTFFGAVAAAVVGLLIGEIPTEPIRGYFLTDSDGAVWYFHTNGKCYLVEK